MAVLCRHHARPSDIAQRLLHNVLESVQPALIAPPIVNSRWPLYCGRAELLEQHVQALELRARRCRAEGFLDALKRSVCPAAAKGRQILASQHAKPHRRPLSPITGKRECLQPSSTSGKKFTGVWLDFAMVIHLRARGYDIAPACRTPQSAFDDPTRLRCPEFMACASRSSSVISWRFLGRGKKPGHQLSSQVLCPLVDRSSLNGSLLLVVLARMKWRLRKDRQSPSCASNWRSRRSHLLASVSSNYDHRPVRCRQP